MVDSSQDRTRSQQGQAREREAQQTRQNPQTRQASQARQATEQVIEVTQPVQEGKRFAFKVGQATVTQGKAGERNLDVQWIDVPLPNYSTARFDVKTAPPNALEVEVQQNFYKKSFAGTGVISVPALPGAPIGTRGKLIARDTSTGETLEIPWVWHETGRGFSLWEAVKRLIWPSRG